MSPSRRIRRKTILAVTAALTVGVILAVTAVVHTRGSSANDAVGTQGQTAGENLTRLGHNLAQCLRTHGSPQIADPVPNGHGDLSWGSQGSQVKMGMHAGGRRACRAQAQALQDQFARPPAPADLHGLVLFAQCMRREGAQDWPDPRPDGTFPLNRRLMGGKRVFLTQLKACRHLNPTGGIAVSPSSRSLGGVKSNSTSHD
jgi:hypothetical protein